MTYRIKNWEEFQHFKDRRPPWIKLHRKVLEQRDINMISDRSFRLLVNLWLLASEDPAMEGNLPPVKDIAWKLRIEESIVIEGLKELGEWVLHDDINMISDRYQDDTKPNQGLVKSEHGLTKSEPRLPAEFLKSETGKPLLNNELQVDDINMISGRYQDGPPETYKQETYKQETEKEKHFSPTFSSEDMKVAVAISDLKNLVYPNHKKPNLKNWAKIIRLIRTIDNRTHEEITKSWEWVMQDDFWSGVCLSPENLRKNWDKIQIRRNKHQNSSKSWQEQQDEQFLKGE